MRKVASHKMDCIRMKMKQRLFMWKGHFRGINPRSALMALLVGSLLMSVMFSFITFDSNIQMVRVRTWDEGGGSGRSHCSGMCTHSQFRNLNLPKGNSKAQIKSGPLLTLFTTFEPKAELWRIQWNVLWNWSLLQPKARMVLFDYNADKSLLYFAKQTNWTILPLPIPGNSQRGDLVPNLKYMYMKCKEIFPTSIYFGYFSGDLFDREIINTLDEITSYPVQLNQSVVIGKRTKFKIQGRRILTLREVRQVVENAERYNRKLDPDYVIITHNTFPWHRIHKDDITMTQSSNHYNFIISTGRKYDFPIIDATQTLTAVHQTEGDSNIDKNRLLNIHEGNGTPYSAPSGSPFNMNMYRAIATSQYKTRFDHSGRIELRHRPGFGSQAYLLTPALTYTTPSNYSAVNFSNFVTMATTAKHYMAPREAFNGHTTDNSTKPLVLSKANFKSGVSHLTFTKLPSIRPQLQSKNKANNLGKKTSRPYLRTLYRKDKASIEMARIVSDNSSVSFSTTKSSRQSSPLLFSENKMLFTGNKKSFTTTNDSSQMVQTMKLGSHSNLYRNATIFREEPLLLHKDLLTFFTLFSTKSIGAQFLYKNVLKNWAQYQQNTKTVLFIDEKNTTLENVAKEFNWTILPAIAHRGTLPPFKKMFLQVKERFPRSVFIGYVKSDLLFSDDLLKTLNTVHRGLEDASNSLVVGMKYRVMLEEGKVLYKSEDIKKFINSEQTMLRSEYDETLLLAHQSFPWLHIPELVIGRSVYNNYVVAQALRHEFPVVDATKTLRCLEQYTNDLTLLPNELDDFDPNLLGTLDYSKGSAIHAQYETVYTNNGKGVKLVRRPPKKKETDKL